MEDGLSSRYGADTIVAALDDCAAEPVHIPGTVQPFACIVVANAKTGLIDYASANCKPIIGKETLDLLGKEFHVVFGGNIAHALGNATAKTSSAQVSTPLGQHFFEEAAFELSAIVSKQYNIVQFETPQEAELGGGDALNALTFLIRELQESEDEAGLLENTTELLRHLTGYDRVMVYRFDADFNGEVIAEARQRTLEPYLGLRFPHWDIPSQARDIMAKIPLRFISDVDAEPVPLMAAEPKLDPLDMTFVECRGVSKVHMQYLRNMGTQSTMTLSVMVDGALWGIISFHHRAPRVPAPKTREVLIAFLEMFCSKLTVLRKQSQLDLARKIDALKDDTLGAIEGADSAQELETAGPAILQATQSDGLAVMTGSLVKRYGQIPDQMVLDHLAKLVHESEEQPLPIVSIGADYPELVEASNGIAGVLAVADGPGRTLFLFRRETATSVSWAGNPDKKIELESGSARLLPRSSFSIYLQEVKGNAKQWTDADVSIAKRIWTLINSAERQELRNRMQKQQQLMINELNHRVRNILSLVRSVSRQARRHNSSLESYSEAIEKRIQALAAAHDLASGDMRTAIAIRELIHIEIAPYNDAGRITLGGTEPFLRADIAPIFSLVIHELATNAVKYGALSVDDGRVDITLEVVDGGVTLAWREMDGPLVVPLNTRGFGSTLIEQAIPYEMGGTAELRFVRTGVEADLFLPNEILEKSGLAKPTASVTTVKTRPADQPKTIDLSTVSGLVLIVEDNFTIAKDTRDQLVAAGLKDVEMCSNADDALDILASEPVVFAILDVNLGPGKTSEPVALRLLRDDIPFFFVTGYSDTFDLDKRLSRVPRFTKPLSTHDLLAAIAAQLEHRA